MSESGDALSLADDSESVEAQENSQTSGKSKLNRSGPLTRDEIASEASLMVYKIITSLLYKCRPSTKQQLFNDLLYLFTGWAQHQATVNQATMKLKWVSEFSGDVGYLKDLPKTMTIKVQDSYLRASTEGQKVDAENLRVLESLLHDHDELCLRVEHDVVVNGTVRRLEYRVNLIEVASTFIASYITLETNGKAKDSLNIDRDCLKPIVTIALGLRTLIERGVKDLCANAAVPWIHNVINKGTRGRPKKAGGRSIQVGRQYPFEIFNGMNIDDLQPSASRQKDCLSILLNMTEEEYKVRNEVHSNVQNIEGLQTPSEDDKLSRRERIEGDVVNGVYTF